MLEPKSAKPDAAVSAKGLVPKLITKNAAILKSSGVETPEAEIESMLCHLLEVNRLNLYLHGYNLINDEIISRLDRMVARRATRYPLQMILQEYWFFGRKFFVNDDVMVPAPETELLCEGALTYLRSNKIKSPRILDIGTGSGVIAITLACEYNVGEILALDISRAAMNVARRNADSFNLNGKIEFRESNLLGSVKKTEKFDLIISNPPYVTEEEYKNLAPEVHADPKISITSGEDGLDAIRVILEKSPEFLAKSGRIMFEIGHDQAERITKITEMDSRYDSLSILKDFNNFDRIAILTCTD